MFFVAQVRMRIDPARAEDLPQMLALLELALGRKKTAQEWRWKHEDNPFGRSDVLLAWDGDALVGLRAFMRWTFNGSIRAVRAVDTATHPDHQGKGIFTTLTRALLDATDAEFVFNTPNGKSGPGYLKMGWQKVGRIDVWARAALGRRRLPQSPPTPHPLDDARLHTVYTPETLRWRYGDGYDTYALDGASAVVRRKGRELRVCELFVAPGGIVAAARLLHRIATTTTGVMTAVAPFDTPRGKALALGGFVPLPRIGPTLMTRPLKGRARGRSEWAASLGDLELF